MDLNRLFTMLAKLFMRHGIKYGVDYLARRGKPEAELTPEELKQRAEAKAMADKARKASRLAGRFLR